MEMFNICQLLFGANVLVDGNVLTNKVINVWVY